MLHPKQSCCSYFCYTGLSVAGDEMDASLSWLALWGGGGCTFSMCWWILSLSLLEIGSTVGGW